MIKCSVLKRAERPENEDSLNELMGNSMEPRYRLENAIWTEGYISANVIHDVDVIHIYHEDILKQKIILLSTGWNDVIVAYDENVLYQIIALKDRLQEEVLFKEGNDDQISGRRA